MIKQYYRVFVSSPYLELKEARAKVIDALLRAGHFPMVMEYQAAAPVNQKVNLEARLRGCDVVLVILGASYGSRIDLQNPSSISYTEFEFNTAQEIGIPIIPLTLDSARSSPDPFVAKFLAKLSNSEKHTEQPCADENDLPSAAVNAIETARVFEVSGCVPNKGVIEIFTDPLTVMEFDELLMNEYAHDVAHDAGKVIASLGQLRNLTKTLEWDEYCKEVKAWLDRHTRDRSCDIKAVCSQKPWGDEGLDKYFEIYYNLAERRVAPCTVERVFIERVLIEAEKWGPKPERPEKDSAWDHIKNHCGRDRVTPFVMLEGELNKLDERLKRFGGVSGFVLITHDEELVSAMIHNDDRGVIPAVIHAAWISSDSHDGMLFFLHRIFKRLQRGATELRNW